MIQSMKDVLGFVYVEERDNRVVVGGIWTRTLIQDMIKIWKNPKAMSYIFDLTKLNTVSFNKFFAVDVLYMFETILENKKTHTNKYRLFKLIELLRSETWLKSMSETHPSLLDYSELKHMHHQLFPHQTEALKIYDETISKMHLNGFLLAADVGTGKTIMSLAIATCLRSDIVIIVCQKSLVDQVWVAAIHEEFGDSAPMWSTTSSKPLTPNFRYYIFHYETLTQAVDFCKQFKNERLSIILDESHNLNEMSALRTQRFIDLVKATRSKHTLFLSGTAVKALGSEMVPLLTCIDPFFDSDAAERFKMIYGASAQRAVDILANRLNLISHKIPKSVVMKIEEPIVKKLSIKIPNGKKYTIDNVKKEMQNYIEDKMMFYMKNIRSYEKIYDDCVEIYKRTITTQAEREDFKRYESYIVTIKFFYDPVLHKEEVRYCNEFEKTKIIPSLPPAMKQEFKNAKSIVKYVKLKVLGEALGNVLTRLRAECNSEMIEYSGLDEIVKEADKKTLCFSSYIEVIQTAEKYFKKAGLSPVSIYGEHTKNVDGILNEFKTNPDINPMLATFKSLATGVTLTVCNCCVFFDLPFRDYIREQAAHRIFRIGQDTQCYFYECTLNTDKEPNISTKAEEIMEWSKEQVDLILGRTLDHRESRDLMIKISASGDSVITKAFQKFLDWF